jgi:SAM-dependent methyltransferase
MTWSEIDWAALDRLRGRFLSATGAIGPYWENADALANYDFTYGERIGWKWDQVLRELRLHGWRPGTRSILDWGCGSGIAARRVIDFFGAGSFDSLAVWDHSPLACDFAAETTATRFPALRVSQATPGFLASTEPVGLLLVSHVLNELSPEALTDLRAVVARAEAVLWVEPGTHAVSRQLGTLRDEFRSAFHLVAPCTHAGSCPILLEGNERHWCHFFAPPPAEIFADSHWVKFGQRAGIDLRSLPYCFLAADRSRERGTPAPPAVEAGGTPALPPLSRVIGRVEHFKPYARWLNCDASGLAELELPKRADLTLFKQLDRTRAPLVYRWRRDGRRVLGGVTLAAVTSTPAV